MNIYERMGVRRVINCVSTTSPLGSSVAYPEVMDAMKDAATHYVCVDELQEKAGEYIASITGAESALVTSGCSAALTMATAACIMKGTPLEKYGLSPNRPAREVGEWRDLIQRLPDTEGLKNEVVIQKSHVTIYSMAHRVAGARLVTVGTDDGCTAQEVQSVISSDTAAIEFTGMHAKHGVRLEEVVGIGQRNNVPIVMDAAYTIPPRANLRKWVAIGVDLVCYSGGKSIRGPSDTGFLCGRRDLVNLAAIQMSPHNGIGRGFKVDKTQIVGLLRALEIYVSQDDDKEFEIRDRKARYITDQIGSMPHIKTVERRVAEEGLLRGWPIVNIRLDEKSLGMKTSEVVDRLYEGTPSIWTYYDNELYCQGGITMNTQNLMEGEERIVVDRLRTILTRSHS